MLVVSLTEKELLSVIKGAVGYFIDETATVIWIVISQVTAHVITIIRVIDSGIRVNRNILLPVASDKGVAVSVLKGLLE